MTVQPVAAPAAAGALLAEASAQQATRTAVAVQGEAAIVTALGTMQAADAWSAWVAGIGEQIYVLLSLLQELVATEAADYVRRMLRIQNLAPTGPTINPLRFAGIASDNRSLESLLAGAVVHMREAERLGETPARQRERGQNYLRMVVRTQVADAGRAAESVANVVAQPVRPERPAVVVSTGWVRMLNPPSCSRCAVLAGRFYRWSEGFQRHEMCDCIHIPATENVADDLTTDPLAYFNSLTEQEQTDLFGKAVSQAIRDGGDIQQVVNAATRPGVMFTADRGRRYTREGVTRRGTAGRRIRRERGKQPVLRPTPWQIYQDAKGDREAAISLLREFGYLVQ